MSPARTLFGMLAQAARFLLPPAFLFPHKNERAGYCQHVLI
jgi:hypothetical protein